MHSILAVDDSVSMRQMVSFTLKSAGYTVVEAVDGQDAWEKAAKQDFDLVLTDYSMPVMSGMEVARTVASLRPDLPVMIVSGFIGTVMRLQAAWGLGASVARWVVVLGVGFLTLLGLAAGAYFACSF